MAFSQRIRSQAVSADNAKRFTFDWLSYDGGKTHPWLECRVAGQANKAYREAVRKLDDAKAIAAAKSNTDAYDQYALERAAKLIVAGEVVTAWGGWIDDDGTEPALSADALTDLLLGFAKEDPTSLLMFIGWVQNPNNFRLTPKPDAAELGKT